MICSRFAIGFFLVSFVGCGPMKNEDSGLKVIGTPGAPPVEGSEYTLLSCTFRELATEHGVIYLRGAGAGAGVDESYKVKSSYSVSSSDWAEKQELITRRRAAFDAIATAKGDLKSTNGGLILLDVSGATVGRIVYSDFSVQSPRDHVDGYVAAKGVGKLSLLSAGIQADVECVTSIYQDRDRR